MYCWTRLLSLSQVAAASCGWGRDLWEWRRQKEQPDVAMVNKDGKLSLPGVNCVYFLRKSVVLR